MYMKRIKINKIFIGLIFCVAALTAIVMNTRPDEVPSFVFVVFFLFLYIAFSLFALVLVRFVRSAGGFRWRSSSMRRFSFGISVVPILLLILQSIGQLTVQDTLLTFSLAVIAYFYYQRFFGKQTNSENNSVQ